jgi:hypothetical protein
MQQISQKFQLYIRNVKKKGRGVFSKEHICEGEVVEIAPALKIPKESEYLEEYLFCGPDDDYLLIGFGYASFYNHDDNPNLNWVAHKDRITFKANRDIAPKTELTIHYDVGKIVVFYIDGTWKSFDSTEEMRCANGLRSSN